MDHVFNQINLCNWLLCLNHFGGVAGVLYSWIWVACLKLVLFTPWWWETAREKGIKSDYRSRKTDTGQCKHYNYWQHLSKTGLLIQLQMIEHIYYFYSSSWGLVEPPMTSDLSYTSGKRPMEN